MLKGLSADVFSKWGYHRMNLLGVQELQTATPSYSLFGEPPCTTEMIFHLMSLVCRMFILNFVRHGISINMCVDLYI